MASTCRNFSREADPPRQKAHRAPGRRLQAADRQGGEDAEAVSSARSGCLEGKRHMGRNDNVTWDGTSCRQSFVGCIICRGQRSGSLDLVPWDLARVLPLPPLPPFATQGFSFRVVPTHPGLKLRLASCRCQWSRNCKVPEVLRRRKPTLSATIAVRRTRSRLGDARL